MASRRRSARLRAASLLVVALAVPALAACTSDEGEGASSTTGPAAGAGEGEPVLVPVATLDHPTAMAVRPGSDDLYVAELAGRVRVIERDEASTADPDAHHVVDDPVLDISDRVESVSGGLVGLAFSPEGDELYLGYTGPTFNDTDIRLERFAVDADGVVDADSGTEVVTVKRHHDPTQFGQDPDTPPANHIGGDVHFGPDGMLYFSVGDGGPPVSQQNDRLFGKLLRIDPTGTDPDHPAYSVPDDNPFVGEAGALPEIWAYGLRNPFRFSFDPETGDLWVADVGEATLEEVDLLPADEGGGAGANLGWPRFEGTDALDDDPPPPDAIDPTYEYEHGDGRCAVTGGVVYRGEELPDLEGRYLFGDLCGRSLLALDVSGDEPVESTVLSLGEDEDIPQFVSFGVDDAGEVYVSAYGTGEVYRLTAG